MPFWFTDVYLFSDHSKKDSYLQKLRIHATLSNHSISRYVVSIYTTTIIHHLLALRPPDFLLKLFVRTLGHLWGTYVQRFHIWYFLANSISSSSADWFFGHNFRSSSLIGLNCWTELCGEWRVRERNGCGVRIPNRGSDWTIERMCSPPLSWRGYCVTAKATKNGVPLTTIMKFLSRNNNFMLAL
jgi:hypothetical protein